MVSIATVSPNSPEATHAQTLFRAYGDFLRQTQACGTFNFPRFEEETVTLPAFYAENGGQVLLAQVGTLPAATIAFHTFPADPTGRTCEIKRLFTHPGFRGRGLARTLIAEVLTRARIGPWTRLVLDTDIVNMPAALPLYRSFGFTEYGTRQGNIAFFERPLP